MTGLPLSRKSSIAVAISSSLGTPPPASPPRSRYSELIRSSSAADPIASTTSSISVSDGLLRNASAIARSTGSPVYCSTSGPSGAITSAACCGTSGIDLEKTAQMTPKISSSRIRCRILRSPSRPCQIQRRNLPIACMGQAGRANRVIRPATARLRPSLRCALPCRCGRAGSRAWRGGRCRDA